MSLNKWGVEEERGLNEPKSRNMRSNELKCVQINLAKLCRNKLKWAYMNSTNELRKASLGLNERKQA